MASWTFLILWVQLFLLALGEQKDSESLCARQQTCGTCLQTPRCVWCSTRVSDQSSSGRLVRCVTREKFQREGDSWCQGSDVMDEGNSMVVLQNRSLSWKKGEDPVQVQPQKIRLRLRRGEEYRVTLRYSQAKDYPVDLYYLMDLSASMSEYKDNLSKLGSELAGAMRNLTSNFRLGFGSFVDKVVMPMTNTHPDKLKSPCFQCAPPYGYKHQMSLSVDDDLFKIRVKQAATSGNLDSPEGGFDAMLQAMVCTKEIGWRQAARHLIVFSTDAGSHIAGDGRLAGIIEPNDGLCHLDQNGYYTHSLLKDYPSISQINKTAREHNTNIIFAVPYTQKTTYSELSESISGSSVGTLENDSQNVAVLVSGEYEKLVTAVAMTDNARDAIDVKYFSRCLEKDGEPKERQECGGLRVGDVVEFEVVLKAVGCLKDSCEWQRSIQIKPRDINESLTIDLSIIHDCLCEQPEHQGYEPGSEACKGNGTLICGVCSCNRGFHGRQCECEGNRAGPESAADMAVCKPSNESAEICSGRGACKCGMCNCAKRSNENERFYGKYCECDNFSCKRSNGLLCGNRGKCDCGVCICSPHWGGETCDCKESNSTCMPRSGEICSGRGDCICGSCHCHEKDNIRYSGQYCEECPTCPDQRCEELKDCVECVAHNAGPLAKNGKCDPCPRQINIVDVVEEDPVEDKKSGARICRTPGDAGCTFIFKYVLRTNETDKNDQFFEITAQKERTCPTPINVIGVAVGVVISTVILGFLILLAWKIATMIHDKREFAKFERERALAKWDRGDNPLYKKATSTFKNPTFNETVKD